MNRAARRLEERENKSDVDKVSRLINKLTPDQIKLIDSLSNTKAKNIADKQVAELSMLLDRNLRAALITLGFNLNQIDRIENLMAKFTEEDSKKYKELNKKYKHEEFEEVMKKIEIEIRKEIEILLEKGVVKKQAIEELQFKFPSLSRSMITNAYQQVKEELENKEVDEAIKYILSDDEETKNLEENANKIIETAKEIQCKEKVEDKTMENKLKVLSMMIKGENGTYKVCEKGVELQGEGMTMFFENLQQLDDFTKEYKEVFSMRNN